MIDQYKFLEILNDCGIDFFTGVPDSYLNGFCNCILEKIDNKNNIIAANEGNAVGIASGYYLSTKKIPLVYMQNSGVGNAVNPLVSLADKDVYNIPMVLLIGWRGEPNTGDHDQHKKQGEITVELLQLMGIPFIIAEDNDELLESQTREIINLAYSERKTVAIIARNGIFTAEKKLQVKENGYSLFREEAIEIVMDTLPKDTIYVATTGRATRELYFIRERRGENHDMDFLNVGSMGHASSVALSIALQNPNRKVVCLDGDAAAIMHMGAFSMVSKLQSPNFIHIILNNGAHESVGNQPSVGTLIDFTTIACGCGYSTTERAVSNKEDIILAVNQLKNTDKASLIDIRIKEGMKGKLPSLNIDSHEDLGNNLFINIANYELEES